MQTNQKLVGNSLMKICYLADAQSAHTQRWVRAVRDHGHEVMIVSFRPADLNDIPVYHIHTPKVIGIGASAPLWSRFHYLLGTRKVKKVVSDFQPDIVHAFYATSYGFTAAKLKFPRYFVSVWGQDVTRSNQNFVMRFLVKYALRKAETVFCTSEFLMNETSKIINDSSRLLQLPFGIDTNLFRPVDYAKQESNTLFGCIKPMEPFYGVETLLKAFEQAYEVNKNLRLLLNKSGSLLDTAKNFIDEKDLGSVIRFFEPVEHDQVPGILIKLDVLMLPSLVESFGVSALEGSACGLPIIGSKVGGIPEVLKHGVTGLLVPCNNADALSKAMLRLADDKQLRDKMGKAGRKFVSSQYVWDDNVKSLVGVYTMGLKKN